MSLNESSRRAGILLAFLVVISAFSPLISTASATGAIELSLSDQHLLISPGTTANITLTIHNNDSQINDYTVELNSNYNSAWNISIIDSIVEDVLPTFSRTTTIVVTLDSLALLSDQTVVEFLVNQSGSSENSSINAVFSVQPHYEASIDTSNVGLDGLLMVNPGSTIDINIDVMNLGNMNDTILLDVTDEPDLVQWWEDYNLNQSSPIVNGNETITLLEPISNSEYDISQNDVEIVTNASGLTPNLAYDLDVEAISEDGISLNSWSSVLNSTTGLDSFNTQWVTSDEGNVTIWSNISYNGSILSSDFSTICLYDVYGCSVIAQYSLSEGTITGNGSLSYAFDSNGTTYVPGDLVDDGTSIEIVATADENWSFTEFNGDSNSTSDSVVIIIDADKSIGALFEENQTIVLVPEINVTVITNATHMFSTFELSNLTQGDDYNISFDIRTDEVISIPVDAGWDEFTATSDNLSRYYNATFANDSYCIDVVLSKVLVVLDSDSFCFIIPSSSNATSTTMSVNSGKSTSNLPSGWAVYWIDDVYTNMSPMSTENALLRIVIPNGTAPGYIGIRLWASSTQGNISMSTVIVIQVGSQDSIGISDVTNHTWLPDQSAEVMLEIMNTGNRDVGYDYSTESSLGPCDVVVSSIGSTLEVGEKELALVSVRPWEVAHRNDTCEFNFIATNRLNGNLNSYHVQIRIGVTWGLELYSPSIETLGPDETKTVTFTVKNLGTEQDEYRVELITPTGVIATPPPGWLTISRGQTSIVDIDFTLESDSNLSGIITVTIKLIGLNGAETEINYTLDVYGQTSFQIVGPQDSRLQIMAGNSAELLIDLINTGTQENNYDLKSVSGMPSCINLNGTNSDLTEAEQNSIREMSIGFEANTNCQSGDFQIIISVEELESGITEQINVTLQISSLGSVDISSSSTSSVVDDNVYEQLTLTVTNLGSDTSIFEVTVNGALGFDVSLETSILSLNPGEQNVISLGIKRTTAIGTLEITVSVQDTSESSVSDSIIITAIEPLNMAELIVQASNTIIMPGDTLTGNLLISNQGNQNDNFSISSSGINCAISSSVEIDAQQSATLAYSCETSTSTDVGSYILTFTAISSKDITKQNSETLQYQISSDYTSGSDVVGVSLSVSSISMNYDGSGVMTVTLVNLLNQQVTGNLNVEGSDVGSFEFVWDGFIDDAEYELDSYSQMSITLTITPKTDASIITTVKINALSQVGSDDKIDSSEDLTLSVDGLRLPPNGLDLKFGELDETQTMIGLFSGWGIIVLVTLLRIRRFKNRNKNSVNFTEIDLPLLDELPPIDDLPLLDDTPLPKIELPELPEITESISLDTQINKLASDGTVRCPKCQAKLRPPSGKSPPFRFTCPKCTEIVRVS